MTADNQTTFTEWVNLYSDMLYAYTLKHGFETDNAKDMVQETFLSAWRNMDQYKGDASVKNWLFILLKSRISDHFRKPANKLLIAQVREEHNDNSFFDEEEHWRRGMYPQQWNANHAQALEQKEFYTVFDGCGKKLKAIQNTVFVMKYVDGMDSEEICKELNISAANYWVLVHRAKVQLRACLEKNWLKK
jgi:RNA polymerase sigma-70 factor (ECF subfamily)